MSVTSLDHVRAHAADHSSRAVTMATATGRPLVPITAHVVTADERKPLDRSVPSFLFDTHHGSQAVPRVTDHWQGWAEMIFDNELSVRAVAYHLRDLQDSLDAAVLDTQTTIRGRSRHELIAYGYNSGQKDMLEAATGQNEFRKNSYMDTFAANWKAADQTLCNSASAAFSCG